MAKQDIGELEHLKIIVLSEKGFNDSELFLRELAECGGMEAKHSDLKITQENIIGFATLIEANDRLYLLDTTGRWEVLEEALRVRGYEPGEIEGLFLTHEHFDHIGGAEDFLKHHQDIDVWIPVTFSQGIKDKLSSLAKNIHEVAANGIVDITPGLAAVMMPGEFILGIQGELLLAANIREKGLMLLVGCSHPGIGEIIHYAKARFTVPLFGMYGGFHISPFHQWGPEQDAMVQEIADAGLSIVAGNHCTGKLAVAKLQEVIPDIFHPAESGEIIIL